MLQRTKFLKLKWNAYLLCHRLPEFNGEPLPSIICRLHVEWRSHYRSNNQRAGRCTRILRKCTLRTKQEFPEQYHSASYYRESFAVGPHNGNVLFGVLAWPYEVVPWLRPTLAKITLPIPFSALPPGRLYSSLPPGSGRVRRPHPPGGYSDQSVGPTRPAAPPRSPDPGVPTGCKR